MPFKARTESDEIKILRLLNIRMNLPEAEKKRYLKMKKGFEGELLFDTYTACLDNKFYVLNDLELEVNHTPFQIDSLIITQHSLVPCEIKHFEGKYYYEEGNFFYYHTKGEITNPLHQLNKGETLFRQLLKKYGYQFSVKGNLVFTHPDFFLYQAPLDHQEIIYHQHLDHFISDLKQKPSNMYEHHLKLAELFVQLHKPHTAHKKIPEYHYEQLQKGITCGKCLSFNITVGERRVVCLECGEVETVHAAVIRSLEELRLLFPEMKITTNVIFDWCGKVKPKKSFYKILAKHYQANGHGKYTFFID